VIAVRTARLSILFAGLLAMIQPASAQTLDLWPAPARAQIESVVAHAPPGSYATFDADNTIWKNDIEEGLLPFLENKGVLSIARLDPSLKPIPVLKGEGLYGYYQRLCAIDDKLCYPWIVQVFAGRPLADLKRDVDAMMASTAPIPVAYVQDGKAVSSTVFAPAIFPAQRQLMAYLRAHGVKVYVVSASAEELVRMVVSDPQYGFNVAPENVVGVTAMLRNPDDGSVTNARRQIALGHYLDDVYPATLAARMVLTPILWTPQTWYEGKVAGIQAYIDPVRRPLLAAGDSPSDWPMLFYAGGVRIWVDRKGTATPRLAQTRVAHAATERAVGLTPPLAADAGWVIVTQAELAR
jgi:phosphoserine phosphatase